MKCHPGPLARRGLLAKLGLQWADSFCLAGPSGLASAAECCLVQGPALSPPPAQQHSPSDLLMWRDEVPHTAPHGWSSSGSPLGVGQRCPWGCIAARCLPLPTPASCPSSTGVDPQSTRVLSNILHTPLSRSWPEGEPTNSYLYHAPQS